jgi:hypothetical protein
MKNLIDYINESKINLEDEDVKLLLNHFNVSSNRIKRSSNGGLIITGNCRAKAPEEIKDLKVYNLEEVKGSFVLHDCQHLTTLEGCPKKVGNCFAIINLNNITTLEGGPEQVLGEGRKIGFEEEYYCGYCNNLISLKGAPKQLNGGFVSTNNPKLKTLKYLPVCISVTCIDLNYEDNKQYIEAQYVEMKDVRLQNGVEW